MADEDTKRDIKKEPDDADTSEVPAWKVLWELPAQVAHCDDDDLLTLSPKATENPENTGNRKLAHNEMKQLQSVSVKTEKENTSDDEGADLTGQSSIHEKDNKEMMNVADIKSEPVCFDEHDQASSRTREGHVGRSGNSSMKRSLEEEHANSSKKTKLDVSADAAQRLASTSPYPVCLIKSIGEGRSFYPVNQVGCTTNAFNPGTSASDDSTRLPLGHEDYGISTEKDRKQKTSIDAEVYLDNAEDDSHDSITDDFASSTVKTKRESIMRQYKASTTQTMAQTSSEKMWTRSQGKKQKSDTKTGFPGGADTALQSDKGLKQVKEKSTHFLHSQGKSLSGKTNSDAEVYTDNAEDDLKNQTADDDTEQHDATLTRPCTSASQQTHQHLTGKQGQKQKDSEKISASLIPMTKGPAGSSTQNTLPKPIEIRVPLPLGSQLILNKKSAASSDLSDDSQPKSIASKSRVYVNRRKQNSSSALEDLIMNELESQDRKDSPACVGTAGVSRIISPGVFRKIVSEDGKASPSGLTLGYFVKDDTSMASDSKDVAYDACLCTQQSLFEQAEVEAWRMVKLPGKGLDSSIQMKNIGLVRFMNRPLFSFTKDDKLYVYLAEVKFKKLLPLFEHEQSYIRSDAIWKLIAPEVRKPNLVEQVYVENYIYMESAHWVCVMITPHGLHIMYQLLLKMKTTSSQPQSLRWYKHAHALFYQQKLGHHCPWTLQVTPPTGCESAKKRSSYISSPVHKVMKTLTRVHWDRITKQQRLEEVKLCDGGAGTAIEFHQLSPLLGTALSNVIEMFHLEDIAEPFCSCSLSVSDCHLYQPLTINHTVFRHITEMSFIDFPTPLHCWKRNNGFFVSYVEFSQKTLLPPRGNSDVESLLNAAVEGTDVCFMLEPEMLFLTRIQVSKGGKKTVNPDSVDAIIERARGCMHVKNVKKGRYKSSAARSNNLGLLINLLYLRKMYMQLAKTYEWLKPHATAKFFIKHWSHDCPSEKDSLFSPSANEGASDEGDVLEGSEHNFLTEDDGDEMDDNADEKDMVEDDGETNVANRYNSEVGDDDDDDDVEMVENVEEEEREVIDLIESSSDEDDEDTYIQQEPHKPPHQPTGTSGEHMNEADTSGFSKQGTAEIQIRNDKISTGQKKMKQTDDLKQESCDPDHSDDDLHATSHNFGSSSHDLEDTSQSTGSLEVSSIKQERLDTREANLMNLDHIKREITDTDEYFSNLPIAIVTDLQDGQVPGKQDVPVKAAEPSSKEQYDADIVQQIKREQGDQAKKQAATAKKRKEEVDSDKDDDSDNEEAVSFKPDSYLRSCSCTEDSEKGVLTSHSIIQSSINQRNAISILNHVGQAVIGDNFVFTFTHHNTIFMNVGQLQDLGFIKQNVEINSFTHQGPAYWLQKASGFEVAFLINNGVTMTSMKSTRAYLLSAELLSFLSYERRSVVRTTIRKSDICLHRIGHICPRARSIARQVLNNSLYLDFVMKAWAKSFYWQDKLKDVEHRRLAGTQPAVKVKPDTNHHKTSAIERGLASTESQNAEGSGTVAVPKKLKAKKMKSKDQSTYRDSNCALYLRKYKVSDMDTNNTADKSTNSKSTFYVCSPNFMGGVNIVKRKTVCEKAKESQKQTKGKKQDEEKDGESIDERDHQTNILEGAMLPKWFRDKNQCLKSGVGFVELDTTAVESWIGNMSTTHHLVLTGTLTTGIREYGEPFSFSCMRVKDKLYINWGELCSQMVGICTIYRLARQLHVFLYSIPTILGLHFSRHYGSCMDTMSTKPWVCVNSINAVAWLGVIDTVSSNMFPKTFSLLNEHFQNTDHWNLQFRNFLLIPKAEFVPM